MKLEFEKPITPNFVRTKNAGLVPVNKLNRAEIYEFVKLIRNDLLLKSVNERLEK